MTIPKITVSSPPLRRLQRFFRDFIYYTLPELLVIAGVAGVLLGLIDRFFFRR